MLAAMAPGNANVALLFARSLRLKYFNGCGDPDFSCHATMRFTFAVLSEVSKQLLDGLQ